MNIYSTAKRLRAPYLITEQTRGHDLPIGARGLIGDGHTAALVRVDGAIDWLCMPSFDSPSVFGQLLDADKGGVTSLEPASRPYESLQRYDPDTNVLETLFQVRGQGVLRVVDYMPWSDDSRATIHEVHRRVECFESATDLNISFDPRFDYGRESTRLETSEHGVLARGSSGDTLAMVLGADVQWGERDAGGLQACHTMQPGQRLWCVLSWGAPRPEPLQTYRPFDCLRYTRAAWREWSRKLGYEGPWRDHVMRSALLLKALIYAPTGAMVAAPTTSLPEWLGGHRNWDYRFAWTRDAALAIRAANLIGYGHEAREFFHFVRDVVDDEAPLKIMYNIHGAEVPEEQELAHLAGFQGSGPVRIGNGARDQLQFDTPGYLLDAALAYQRSGGTLTLRVWRRLRAVVEMARQQANQPDHGIWEPRMGARMNLHSQLMSWVTLDRGRRIAPLFGEASLARQWGQDADALSRTLLQRGLDRSGRRFASAYGTDEVDSTLLLLGSYGLLDAADPRMVATREHVVRELGDRGFLYRYRNDDGVGGAEGAFLLCGFWLAETLAEAGEVGAAEEVFVRHAEASNHVGLLAEEIDPSTGDMLGNFPQAFSHMGLINAAVRIDRAMRLRDEGSPHHP